MTQPQQTEAGQTLRKLSAWRSHPAITNNVRHLFPGLGTATAIFAVYVVADLAFSAHAQRKGGDKH